MNEKAKRKRMNKSSKGLDIQLCSQDNIKQNQKRQAINQFHFEYRICNLRILVGIIII